MEKATKQEMAKDMEFHSGLQVATESLWKVTLHVSDVGIPGIASLSASNRMIATEETRALKEKAARAARAAKAPRRADMASRQKGAGGKARAKREVHLDAYTLYLVMNHPCQIRASPILISPLPPS